MGRQRWIRKEFGHASVNDIDSMSVSFEQVQANFFLGSFHHVGQRLCIMFVQEDKITRAIVKDPDLTKLVAVLHPLEGKIRAVGGGWGCD